MALRAFDLLECLDILVFGTVHDREDLRDEMGFITRPVAARTCIQGFQIRSFTISVAIKDKSARRFKT